MMEELANAGPDTLDGEIQHQLGRVLTKFDLDRGAISELLPPGAPPRVTHAWAREGFRPISLEVNPPTELPWLVRQVLRGETVILPTIDDLPAEATADREFAASEGIKSTLAIPLRVNGVVTAALTCSTMTRKRNWNAATILRLTIVANVFASASWRRWATEQIHRVSGPTRRRVNALMAREVAASLSHELNQPLTAILTNAEAARRMLSASEPDLAEAGAALLDIVRDTRRAADIMSAVRALVQGREAEKTTVTVADLVRTAEQALRQEALRRKTPLRIQVDGKLPAVVGNHTQLLQVLINLINNSLDATADKPVPSRDILIKATMGDNRVLVAVIDNGTGIDPVVMPRLFNPFITSKREGMGMGLAIARTIVEDHGGTIIGDSRAGEGATFIVALPIPSSTASKEKG